MNFEIQKGTGTEHKNIIRTTLKKLSKKFHSCITFNETNSGHRVYIITNSYALGIKHGGCRSNLGYIKEEKQEMILDAVYNCIKPGIIEHETLHSLGEETRKC